MAKLEILLPSMGEGVTEATITRWLKKTGDTVQKDEPLLEVATDKVDSEIAAPHSGVLQKQIYKDGDTVQVGMVLGFITAETGETTGQPETEPENKPVVKTEQHIGTQKQSEQHTAEHTAQSKTPAGKFLSPLVRKIVTEEKINIAELDTVTGTGLHNRITKDDIFNFIENKKHKAETNGNTIVTNIPPAVKQPEPVLNITGNYRIVEMDRMRKLIAEHMVHSKHVAPHVTSFTEADVTNLVQWRDKFKDEFQKKYNEKLTFTPIFAEAVVKALTDFPMVNVSVAENKIIVKTDINIGLATALPSGNLIVPVIKNAQHLNLSGLAKNVNDLANRARNNKLKPDEITGGTFTITNLGTFGNITGTPIINQPEVAILAIGAIKKRPAVIETPAGDFIGIRQIMVLSLSYDHRVVDGALGGMFLQRIADLLQSYDPNRTV